MKSNNNSTFDELMREAVKAQAPEGFTDEVMTDIRKQSAYQRKKLFTSNMREYWLWAVIAITGVLFVVIMYYREALPAYDVSSTFQVFLQHLSIQSPLIGPFLVGISIMVFWLVIGEFWECKFWRKKIYHLL